MRAFAAWRADAAESRQLKRKVAQAMRGNTLTAVFGRWRDFVRLVLPAEAAEALAGVRAVRTRAALRAWVAALATARAEKARLEGVLRRVVMRMQNGGLSRAFAALRGYAGERKALRFWVIAAVQQMNRHIQYGYKQLNPPRITARA